MVSVGSGEAAGATGPADGAAQVGAARVLGRSSTRRSPYTRTLWGDAWRRFRRHRLAMAGAGVFLFMTAAAILGPVVYPVRINAIDFHASMSPPSRIHPFGTND